MILRRSRSVAPPQTPSFSRTTIACSRHDARTMQVLQIALASSAAASESGKKTSGSRPLQAPWCRHDRSVPDIGTPLGHEENPRTIQCMCRESHLSIPIQEGKGRPNLRLTDADPPEVLLEFHQTMEPLQDNSAGRTPQTLGQSCLH